MKKAKRKSKQKFCKAREHRWGRWTEFRTSRSRSCRKCSTTEIERLEMYF